MNLFNPHRIPYEINTRIVHIWWMKELNYREAINPNKNIQIDESQTGLAKLPVCIFLYLFITWQNW